MRKSNLINVVVCEGKTNVFDLSIINCANIIDKRSVHCPRPNIKSEVVIGDVTIGIRKWNKSLLGLN